MMTKRFVLGVVGVCICLAVAAARGQNNEDEIVFRTVGGISYVYHAFLTVGDSTLTLPGGVTTADVLVVGGGGGGGSGSGAPTNNHTVVSSGGGAGGVIFEAGLEVSPNVEIPITVGGGGLAVLGTATNDHRRGDRGGSSSFGTGESQLLAGGGGGGGSRRQEGQGGASGGGAGNMGGAAGDQGRRRPGFPNGQGAGHVGGGLFTQPIFTSAYSAIGLTSEAQQRAGGGGAGGPGYAGSIPVGYYCPGNTFDPTGVAGQGGVGLYIAAFSPYGDAGWFGGGGGATNGRPGGQGGGGNGGVGENAGVAGMANTGGGGGGSGPIKGMIGGNGGDGAVLLRYALDSVDGVSEDGYALRGNVGRVLAEYAVSLRVAHGDTLRIREEGRLNLGATASLAVHGVLEFAEDSQAQIDGSLSIANGGAIGGSGVLTGNLTLAPGAGFVFSATDTLTVNSGTVDLGDLSVSRLIGLSTADLEIGKTYTLMDGTATFLFGSVQNLSDNPFDLGDGKLAYFQEGSLQLVVIPEPHTLGLLLAAGALLAMRRRKTCVVNGKW